MNPTILKCLLSTAFLAVPSLAVPAQSSSVSGATAPEAQDPAKRTASKERMQVRLAEVLAMLDEDDLSPAQRLKVKAKLQEVMERLAKEQANDSGSAPGQGRSKAWTVEGKPAQRVRAHVIETEGAPDEVVRIRGAEGGEVAVEVVEVAEPVAPVAPVEVVEVVAEPVPGPGAVPRQAKAPRAPRPPKPPRAAKAPRAFVIDADDADDAMGQEEFTRARVRFLDANKAYALAEKDARRAQAEGRDVAEVLDEHRKALLKLHRTNDDVAAAREHLEHGEHGERGEHGEHGEHLKALFAPQRAAKEWSSAKARKLLHEAREGWSSPAAPQNRARVFFGTRAAEEDEKRQAEYRKTEQRATQPRARARVLHVDNDESEVREMIEEMRAEMREIRSLMKELRQKSEELGQNAHPSSGALRAFRPSSGAGSAFAPLPALGSFGGISTPVSGMSASAGVAPSSPGSGQNLLAPAPTKASGSFGPIKNPQ